MVLFKDIQIDFCMNKSIIIIISLCWLLCSIYYTMSKVSGGYAHEGYAMVGTWLASALLLVCIIIYVKKHKGRGKQ